MTPAGERFTQRMAAELAGYERLVLVCGHYEGVDERVREALIDREISIGDYVLTGGELAAMVVVDAVARLVPGVIDAESIHEESHSAGDVMAPAVDLRTRKHAGGGGERQDVIDQPVQDERADGLDPRCVRFPEAAFSNPDFIAATELEGRIFNVHVRRATMGGLAL